MDIKIKFDPPLKFTGGEIREVSMREPKVKDMKAIDAIDGGDLEKEITMISRLTGINIEDLDTLGIKNYKKLQDKYASFFE